MKKTVTELAILAVLAGCSTTKSVTNSDEPIRNQKLSTSFVAEGIKIETDCVWYKVGKSDCEPVAIEATGVTFTNGNSPTLLRNAMLVAGDQARANVSHFLKEEITSSRVTNTIAKNVEKGADTIKSRPNSTEPVEMTDKEAKDGNLSVRENSNDTARTLTTNVRANSQTILRGFRVIKQEVVGAQEVSVTIRWDLDSERTARSLAKRFQ